jgi:hypothetical protein
MGWGLRGTPVDWKIAVVVAGRWRRAKEGLVGKDSAVNVKLVVGCSGTDLTVTRSATGQLNVLTCVGRRVLIEGHAVLIIMLHCLKTSFAVDACLIRSAG